MNSKPRYRALPLGGSLEATFAARAEGTTLVTSTEPLQPYPRRLTDRLVHWAEVMPVHTLDGCRAVAGASAAAPLADVLASPAVHDFFQHLVDSLWASGSGSATRVARALLLVDPPSIDLGEVTDKGSINQRTVLTHRGALVQQLYAGETPAILLPHR